MKTDLELDPSISGLTPHYLVPGVMCYILGKNSINKETAAGAGGFCEVSFSFFQRHSQQQWWSVPLSPHPHQHVLAFQFIFIR